MADSLLTAHALPCAHHHPSVLKLSHSVCSVYSPICVHSVPDGYLGSSCLLMVVNNAALNVNVQVRIKSASVAFGHKAVLGDAVYLCVMLSCKCAGVHTHAYIHKGLSRVSCV